MSAAAKVASTYQNPTRVLFGNGKLASLQGVLEELQPKHILVVLGRKSFKNSPHFQALTKMVSGYAVYWEEGVGENPTQEVIEDHLQNISSIPFDTVIAVGGGSVLDTAKILAVIGKEKNQNLMDYAEGKASPGERKARLIAIPTTSGTGSEVTPYASLETNDKKKITISGQAYFPDVAIVDPLLTYSMPEYVSASSGFDALSQGIESFWSVHADELSRKHALRAVHEIVKNLKRVIQDPHDASAREAMALGSCEAGLAIAKTKTTAVHAVSYPITAHFGVAHGHACALTLAAFVQFNAPTLKQVGAPLLEAYGAKDYNTMAEAINQLMKSAKLERSLGRLQIGAEGVKLILRDGFRPDRIKNNPRAISRDQLAVLLKGIA